MRARPKAYIFAAIPIIHIVQAFVARHCEIRDFVASETFFLEDIHPAQIHRLVQTIVNRFLATRHTTTKKRPFAHIQSVKAQMPQRVIRQAIDILQKRLHRLPRQIEHQVRSNPRLRERREQLQGFKAPLHRMPTPDTVQKRLRKRLEPKAKAAHTAPKRRLYRFFRTRFRIELHRDFGQLANANAALFKHCKNTLKAHTRQNRRGPTA